MGKRLACLPIFWMLLPAYAETIPLKSFSYQSLVVSCDGKDQLLPFNTKGDWKMAPGFAVPGAGEFPDGKFYLRQVSITHSIGGQAGDGILCGCWPLWPERRLGFTDDCGERASRDFVPAGRGSSVYSWRIFRSSHKLRPRQPLGFGVVLVCTGFAKSEIGDRSSPRFCAQFGSLAGGPWRQTLSKRAGGGTQDH